MGNFHVMAHETVIEQRVLYYREYSKIPLRQSRQDAAPTIKKDTHVKSRIFPYFDRGREGFSPSPPSEPCVRFSRTRLSSRWFQHRDRHARAWASVMVKSPSSAKKAFGQRFWSARQRPIPGRFSCLRRMARSRRRINPSTILKT
jgi:hypothetical protein